MTGKRSRLGEFLKRLDAAAPADGVDRAYGLLCRTLNEVEDELTGIPYNPARWMDDGRMYPPQDDSIRDEPRRPDVTKYRSRDHYTWIGTNGAIRIDEVDGPCLLNKPGADGATIEFE